MCVRVFVMCARDRSKRKYKHSRIQFDIGIMSKVEKHLSTEALEGINKTLGLPTVGTEGYSAYACACAHVCVCMYLCVCVRACV
jgi:hypothetical protein